MGNICLQHCYRRGLWLYKVEDYWALNIKVFEQLCINDLHCCNVSWVFMLMVYLLTCLTKISNYPGKSNRTGTCHTILLFTIITITYLLDFVRYPWKRQKAMFIPFKIVEQAITSSKYIYLKT